MKKIIALLLICIMCLFLFTACEKNEEKASLDDVSALTVDDYDNVFNDVVGANLTQNVLKNHKSYKIMTVYYDTDGTTVISSDVSMISSDKMSYETSDGDVSFFGNGENYGFDNELKMPYAVFYLNNDLYKTDYEDFFDRFVFVSNQYKIVDVFEENGNIVFTGELTYKELCEIQGVNVTWMTENEKYQVVFTVNKDTLEASSIVYGIVAEDGSSRLIGEVTYEYDIDDFSATEDFYALTHGEGRTVTIIKDPGSEKEETFTVTVPLKCDVMYYFDDSIQYYYDKEKTNVYTYDMHNTDSDETIYCFSTVVSEGEE